MIKSGDTSFIAERLHAFRPYSSFAKRVGIYTGRIGKDYPATTHVRCWREKLNILHLNTCLIADEKTKTEQITDADRAADIKTWKKYYKDSIPALAIGHNHFYDLSLKQRRILATTFLLYNVSAYLCGDTHLTELNPERQMIRLESGHKQGKEIPNIVATRSIADDNDSYSEVGFCWHYWNEETGEVTVEFRRWSRNILGRTVPNGECGYYSMIHVIDSSKSQNKLTLEGIEANKNIIESNELHTISQYRPSNHNSQVVNNIIQSFTEKAVKSIINKGALPSTALPVVNQIRNGEQIVSFGHYPQTTGGGMLPLEWIVLTREENYCLLLCKHSIECLPFNNKRSSASWRETSLRNWLNDKFFKDAFSETERALIQSVDVSKERTKLLNAQKKDRVFLLSVTEAMDIGWFASDEKRKCTLTDYAVARGTNSKQASTREGHNCWWWLRSLGHDTASAALVYYDGSVSVLGFDFLYNDIGVRPAVWIKIY